MRCTYIMVYHLLVRDSIVQYAMVCIVPSLYLRATGPGDTAFAEDSNVTALRCNTLSTADVRAVVATPATQRPCFDSNF